MGCPVNETEVEFVMVERVDLTEWIQSLKEQLTAAERNSGRNGPPLFTVGSIELQLSVTSTRDVEGRTGLKFWVVEAEAAAKAGSGTYQQMTLTLTPLREINVSDPVDEFDE
ncbi:trypco2 family protein [Sphaerisporangium dianthi]|uniref:Trypco2 family protein n=1 Tax=Sphaerisporangium dianthi TaxID=1436120 RepID=A0ABV9CM32_9ACTN